MTNDETQIVGLSANNESLIKGVLLCICILMYEFKKIFYLYIMI